MAGIDKIYTNSFKEYTELLNWAKNKVYKCPNGIVFNVSNYIYDYWTEDSFKENKYIPISNTPQELDYFLIKDCPLELVQDYLKNVYNEEFYNSVKNGTSEYDTFTKKGKIGKHFKVIHKPHGYLIGKHPLRYKCWQLTVETKDGYSLWYNSTYNKFLWEHELGSMDTSTCCKYKSIKAVLRAMRKWELPIGTTVSLHGGYINDGWVFKVKK